MHLIPRNNAQRLHPCVEMRPLCLPSMAADYDEASIKSVDLWGMAVRASRDDLIERSSRTLQEVTKEIPGRW